MKRSSNEYRLNLIKQAALRNQARMSDDPMTRYIHERLSHQPDNENLVENNKHFSGCHYDQDVGGWISDMWGSK